MRIHARNAVGVLGAPKATGCRIAPMAADDDDSRDLLYVYRIGALEADEPRGELRIGGAPVPLEPKPLALLFALIEQPGQVISRPELLERLWGRSEHLSDNVLANAVLRLRRALGPEFGAMVRNVAGQGYLLDARVERIAAGRRFESRHALEAGAAVPGRDGYRLVAPLGRTASSEVWLAEQAKTRDRRVFKFCSDGERLAALKREYTLCRLLREALGERDDFVRVLDANFAEPPFYLECEYGGVALPDWAAEDGRLAAMPRDARLALFAGVVRAVADAHRVGVLHKDLKPSNVLVAPAPGGGWIARLTDFGSGRLLDADALQRLQVTRLGLTVTSLAQDSGSGTLMYLAPELLRAETPTVQGDVYALGLMLYQIVVGDLRRPLASGWEPEVGDPLLAEDIAAATQGEPRQRLGSAAELLARLGTLEQRRSQRAAEAAQAARMHDAQQALAQARARRPWLAAAFGSLLLGLAASTAFYLRERDALGEARVQAARAQAINDFVTLDLLQSADVTNAAQGAPLQVPALFARASAKAAERLRGDPQAEASVHRMLGQVLMNLSLVREGEAETRAALALLAPRARADDPRMLEMRLRLVRADAAQGRFDAARDAMAQVRRDGGALLDDPQSELWYQAARAEFALHSYAQRFAEALPQAQRAVEWIDARRPDRLLERFSARRELAVTQIRVGQAQQALALMQATLAAPFSAESVGAVNYARGQLQAAQVRIAAGVSDGAEPLLAAARETLQRTLGADDPSAVTASALLADLYTNLGQPERAEPLLADAAERAERRLGRTAQTTLTLRLNRAVVALYLGRPGEALAGLEAERPLVVQQFGEDGPMARTIDFFRAAALNELRRGAEALPLTEGLQIDVLDAAAPGSGWRWRLQGERARALIGVGRAGEGRALLEEAVRELERLGAGEIHLARLRRALRDGRPADD